MTCKEARTLLSPYVDDELSLDQGRDLAAHLDGCWTCGREADSLRRLKERLAGLPVREAPPGFEDRLARRVFARPRLSTEPLKVAGLVAVGSLAAAWLAVRLAEPPPKPRPALQAANERRLDVSADGAYQATSDPIGGGVPVVTVSYARDH